MASRSAPREEPDLGVCDNHPDEPAVETTDGGGAHELQRYCAVCWERYLGTRRRIARG